MRRLQTRGIKWLIVLNTLNIFFHFINSIAMHSYPHDRIDCSGVSPHAATTQHHCLKCVLWIPDLNMRIHWIPFGPNSSWIVCRWVLDQFSPMWIVYRSLRHPCDVSGLILKGKKEKINSNGSGKSFHRLVNRWIRKEPFINGVTLFYEIFDIRDGDGSR